MRMNKKTKNLSCNLFMHVNHSMCCVFICFHLSVSVSNDLLCGVKTRFFLYTLKSLVSRVLGCMYEFNKLLIL